MSANEQSHTLMRTGAFDDVLASLKAAVELSSRMQEDRARAQELIELLTNQSESKTKLIELLEATIKSQAEEISRLSHVQVPTPLAHGPGFIPDSVPATIRNWNTTGILRCDPPMPYDPEPYPVTKP